MEIVIVDSSVWIDYYQPKVSKDIKEAVKELIEKDLVAINGIIAVEVLQGTVDRQGYQKVLSDMLTFKELPLVWDVFRRAADLSFNLRRQGILIPTIDILIAATALENNCVLWHQDSHYEIIAQNTELKTKSWLT
jgi:hypothetical protein